MIQHLSSDKTKTVAKSLGLVAAVLVIVVVANIGNKKAPLGTFLQRTQIVARQDDAAHLDCIAHLTKQSQLLDATQLDNVEAFVPISADAVVAYSDEAGNLHKMAWKEAVGQRRQHLNLDVLKQAHKMTDANAEGSLQVLYPDNTAVMADLNTCQLTALYEPTPQGDVDPRVASQFEQKRAISTDVDMEVEQDEPESMGDIAHGTSPKSTSIFPWTVRVGNPGSNGRPGSGFCSGEIIGYYWVVTSKHCVDDKANNGVEIVAGAKTIGSSTNRQIRRSVRIWLHPSEDIALIKVNPHFRYNNYVNKVPRFMAYKLDGMLVFASGYGASSTYGGMSNRFKYANMYTKSDAWCDNHRSSFAAGKEVCCTGGSGNTCGGDSGGPLVYYRFEKYNLLGINSWSVTGCSDKNGNVDVFESMTYLHGWVLDTMGANYGWSNVVVHRDRCTQARWRRQGSGYVKTGTVRVYCESRS